MSASYTASLIYGILIPKSQLIQLKPNPMYGKYKYDPNTGKLVDKYISHCIDIEEFAETNALNCAYTTDEEYVVIGKEYGNFFIGEDNTEYCSIQDFPTKELTEYIIEHTKSINTEHMIPKLYMVGCCSY